MEKPKTTADKDSMLLTKTNIILKFSKIVLFIFFGFAILFMGFRFVVGEDHITIPQQSDYRPSQSNSYFIEAIDSLSKDLERYPKHVETYLLRGSAYCEIHMYEACLKDYNIAWSLSPRNIQLYHLRGQAYASIGKTTAALADLTDWIISQPKNPVGYFERAEVYLMVKDWEAAEADLDKVLNFGGSLKVQNSLRQIIRALKLENKGQQQKALWIYQQLTNRVGIYKSYPLILLRMADLLISLNQNDEALATLNELLELNPSNQLVKLMWQRLVYPNGIPTIEMEELPFTT